MSHKQFMNRALDLATNGLGSVSPNPLVGCVIVHQNKIIGEGWHKKFGEAHAEVNAINSVKEKTLITESIVYVTLEPCSYHGKTPACTDLLINQQPELVVIASKDPNPKVSGNGIRQLEKAGVKVLFGELEKKAIALNKRFFISIRYKRPYVILKWAQTADGFTARSDYSSKWISNNYSRKIVHKWRTEEDAILVGFNTVRYDNPKLTSREWVGRDPVRVVIDPELELDDSAKIFNSDAKVFVFNSRSNVKSGNLNFLKLNKENMVEDLLTQLYNYDIGSIIIEGGSNTINRFIKEDQWDEARMFTAETQFTDGIKAPELNLDSFEEDNILGDNLKIIYNPKSQRLWQKT